MKELDKTKFLEVFTGLCEVYGKPSTKAIITLYYEVLKDKITIYEFKEAVHKILLNHKYDKMPLPTDILLASRNYINPDDEALLALTKVQDAMLEHGKYMSVIFDDPTIHKVISRMPNGWVGLCELSIKEWEHTVKKDFINLYKLYKNVNIDYPIKLYGLHDGQNTAYLEGGIVKEYVAIVGNKQIATQWMQKHKDYLTYKENKKIVKLENKEKVNELMEFKELIKSVNLLDTNEKKR